MISMDCRHSISSIQLLLLVTISVSTSAVPGAGKKTNLTIEPRSTMFEGQRTNISCATRDRDAEYVNLTFGQRKDQLKWEIAYYLKFRNNQNESTDREVVERSFSYNFTKWHFSVNAKLHCSKSRGVPCDAHEHRLTVSFKAQLIFSGPVLCIIGYTNKSDDKWAFLNVWRYPVVHSVVVKPKEADPGESVVITCLFDPGRPAKKPKLRTSDGGWFPIKPWSQKDHRNQVNWQKIMQRRDIGPVVCCVGRSCKEANITMRSKKFTIRVFTGVLSGSGTDADVYITLYGKDENSGKLQLKNGKFEIGDVDLFHFELNSTLIPLTKVVIGNDDTGAGSAWFLFKVEVDCLECVINRQIFPFNDWISTTKGDRKLTKTLTENVRLRIKKLERFDIRVFTGHERKSGTDAHVFCVLMGKENSGRLDLKGKFVEGGTDYFSFYLDSQLSPLTHIIIGHDNTGYMSGWFLDKVEVRCLKCDTNLQIFPWRSWITGRNNLYMNTLEEDKRLRIKKVSKFNIRVFTGRGTAEGTDANVFCVLMGRGIAEKLKLKKGRFEDGDVDSFSFRLNADLSPLTGILIAHDDSGSMPGWLLEKVEVECETCTIKRQVFPFHTWISTDEGDGKLQKALFEDKKLRIDTTKDDIFDKY